MVLAGYTVEGTLAHDLLNHPTGKHLEEGRGMGDREGRGEEGRKYGRGKGGREEGKKGGRRTTRLSQRGSG